MRDIIKHIASLLLCVLSFQSHANSSDCQSWKPQDSIAYFKDQFQLEQDAISGDHWAIYMLGTTFYRESKIGKNVIRQHELIYRAYLWLMIARKYPGLKLGESHVVNWKAQSEMEGMVTAARIKLSHDEKVEAMLQSHSFFKALEICKRRSGAS